MMMLWRRRLRRQRDYYSLQQERRNSTTESADFEIASRPTDRHTDRTNVAVAALYCERVAAFYARGVLIIKSSTCTHTQALIAFGWPNILSEHVVSNATVRNHRHHKHIDSTRRFFCIKIPPIGRASDATTTSQNSSNICKGESRSLRLRRRRFEVPATYYTEL